MVVPQPFCSTIRYFIRENYENEITEEGNIDDQNIDGLSPQTINRDNSRPSAICGGKQKQATHAREAFFIPKSYDAS